MISQTLALGEPLVELAGVRELEQLKVRAANLTMKSEEALQAIARFCEHQKLNPRWILSFRYVTTAERGVALASTEDCKEVERAGHPPFGNCLVASAAQRSSGTKPLLMRWFVRPIALAVKLGH